MRQYDYSLLKRRIESFGADEFASKLSISPKRLNRLLRCGSEFKADEIISAAILLGIDTNDIKTHFFTLAQAKGGKHESV